MEINFSEEIGKTMIDKYYEDIYHHGILGQKWGIRRFQRKDGSLTPAGIRRYGTVSNFNKVRKAEERARAAVKKAKYAKKTAKEIEKINKKYGLDKIKEREKAEKEKKQLEKSNKKIEDMSDKELQKYLTRIGMENQLLNARKMKDELQNKKGEEKKEKEKLQDELDVLRLKKQIEEASASPKEKTKNEKMREEIEGIKLEKELKELQKSPTKDVKQEKVAVGKKIVDVFSKQVLPTIWAGAKAPLEKYIGKEVKNALGIKEDVDYNKLKSKMEYKMKELTYEQLKQKFDDQQQQRTEQVLRSGQFSSILSGTVNTAASSQEATAGRDFADYILSNENLPTHDDLERERRH